MKHAGNVRGLQSVGHAVSAIDKAETGLGWGRRINNTLIVARRGASELDFLEPHSQDKGPVHSYMYVVHKQWNACTHSSTHAKGMPMHVP